MKKTTNLEHSEVEHNDDNRVVGCAESTLAIRRPRDGRYIKNLWLADGYIGAHLTTREDEALRVSEEVASRLCDYDIHRKPLNKVGYNGHVRKGEWERVTIMTLNS